MWWNVYGGRDDNVLYIKWIETINYICKRNACVNTGVCAKKSLVNNITKKHILLEFWIISDKLNQKKNNKKKWFMFPFNREFYHSLFLILINNFI